MAQSKQRAAATPPRGASLPPPPVYRITLLQLGVLALMLPAIFWLAGTDSAVSFAAGGAVSVVPQAWFAMVLFRWRGRPVRSAGLGYGAEAGKFVLSAVGFALVFALMKPLVAGAVFAGFILMTLVHIVGSALLLGRG